LDALRTEIPFALHVRGNDTQQRSPSKPQLFDLMDQRFDLRLLSGGTRTVAQQGYGAGKT
jgi:hypothetical protein